MYFEHLIEINDPANPLVEALSREQVWAGLMHRVEAPGMFLPGLERCEILSRTPQVIERTLHFGSTVIRDEVTYELYEWVCFASAATPQHAGGRLTICFEQPDPLRLYLRFTYATTLPEGVSPGDAVAVSEFVKAAYRESDVDTVRIIRMLAVNGLPQ